MGHRTFRSPEQWPVRARCHWTEQSLRVPSLDLAWAHFFTLVKGEGRPFSDSRGGASNILLGQTLFKLNAGRKEAMQRPEPALALADVRGS